MDLHFIKILLISNDSAEVQNIKKILKKSDHLKFKLVNVAGIENVIPFPKRKNFDVIFLELNLSEGQDHNAYLTFKKQVKGIPIIIITNEKSIKLGIEAVKDGAQDFLTKGQIDDNLLIKTILCTLERHKILKNLLFKIQDIMSSEIRLINIIENNADGIVIIDKNGKTRFFSPAAEILFGQKAGNLIGKLFRFPVVAGQTSEIDIIRSEDDKITAEMRVVKIDWEGDSAYLATLRDITRRNQMTTYLKKAREKERHLAYHDALTNLPNRLLFYDRLGRAIVQAKRYRHKVTLLFLDLDKFKPINDSLGHHVGDLLLKAVAERLKKCLRESDTIARLGGDEFTIILDHIVQQQDSDKIAQTILHELSKPFIIEQNRITIAASIGISFFPNDGQDIDALVKNADIAMYLAKTEGNNYQYFNSSNKTEALERLNLERNLRLAIENEELVLHYQPQVDLYTNKITGVEALVRWQHPKRGLLPPSKFISLAEESGLIVPLGDWVLRTATKQIKAWQDAGFHSLRVAVNLSARQFRVMRLDDVINRVVTESGLEPHSLVLEITESCAMQNVEYTISTLNTLKKMGIKISMDDFGTGYASLSYLKRFPLDILKIDRSFVNGLHSYHDDWAIASAIVAMAHRLKLKVLAEGVENAEQLVFLRTLKCDEMQGFYFSKPVPVNKLTKLLKSN